MLNYTVLYSKAVLIRVVIRKPLSYRYYGLTLVLRNPLILSLNQRFYGPSTIRLKLILS